MIQIRAGMIHVRAGMIRFSADRIQVGADVMADQKGCNILSARRA